MADYKKWDTQQLEDLVKKYKEEIERNTDVMLKQQLAITLSDMEIELSGRNEHHNS